jgi:hypothetical protein
MSLCPRCNLRPRADRPRSNRGGYCRECERENLKRYREEDNAKTFPPGWKLCRCCGERLYWVEDWIKDGADWRRHRYFCDSTCRQAWIEQTIDLELLKRVLSRRPARK